MFFGLKRFKEKPCSMDRCHRWIGLTLSLLTILSDPGFGSSIIEGPRNLTVLVGSMARFNCTVSEGWGVLIWLFDGNPRLTLLSDGKYYASPRYSQQSHRNGTLYTSELMITDVQRNDTGQIKCSIQNEEDNMYAYLFVQEGSDNNQDERNRTIILAVVLSVVGLLLVIFIILLIVCCKRRRESNYQKEMKRNISENKTTNRNLETTSHSGNENYGYSPEETMYDTVQMRGNATVRPRFYGPNQDANMSHVAEVHSNRQQDEALPSRITAYPVHPRKIRNVTLV